MKKISKIILCCLFPLVVGAQQPLTLDQCREMALTNNKQIRVAAQSIEKAGYDVKAYRANFLLRFTATGNYLYTNSDMKKTIPGNYLPTFIPDADNPGSLIPNILTEVNGTPIFKEYAYFPDMNLHLKFSNTYTAGIRAEQPIYMGGKITAAYKASMIGKEIASLNQNLTRSEVILQTDEAYWTYVKTTELHKTAIAYKDVVSELLRNVENAREAGLKSQNDVLKVQVKLNEAELQLRQAENGVRLSRMNLCHVIGLPLDNEIDVSADFDATLPGIAPNADITQRPEYAILSEQVNLKHEQVKLARSEFLPEIGVAATFNYGYGLKLNGDPLLDNTAFSAIASVKIPLFHWGEGRNKVRSAKAEKQIARIQRDDWAEKMELELTQSINLYDEALLEVELTNRSVQQADENLRVSRDHYDTGKETLSNLLEAQAVWQQARANQINAQASLRLNETRYLKAAGKL